MNAIINSFQRTYSFQIDLASLCGLQDVSNTRFKSFSNENSRCQVIKDDVLKGIFVSWGKIYIYNMSYCFDILMLERLRIEIFLCLCFFRTVVSHHIIVLSSCYQCHVKTVTSVCSIKILANVLGGQKSNYFWDCDFFLCHPIVWTSIEIA